MAALWLHTASLLVLLVMSCPGSHSFASVHLCGSHLVDALYLVCGDRGFHYMPGRDDNLLQHFMPPKENSAASVGGEGQVAELASQDQMEMMVKRSQMERCCLRPCSITDLAIYCN